MHLIGRSNRTTKERVRCLTQILPFSCVPTLIIEAVLNDSSQNLNRLPRKSSVSKHLSPLTIITSVPKLDCTKLKSSFGEYAEVCEDNGNQINISKTRGAPAITLSPVHNSSGSYYFNSLVTGHRLARG